MDIELAQLHLDSDNADRRFTQTGEAFYCHWIDSAWINWDYLYTTSKRETHFLKSLTLTF